jgi:hypothetical protein
MLISDIFHAASSRVAGAACAMTPLVVGLSSSSLLSSSNDRWEFHELTHGANKARQRLSDTTREVGRLERCLTSSGWPSPPQRGRSPPRGW